MVELLAKENSKGTLNLVHLNLDRYFAVSQVKLVNIVKATVEALFSHNTNLVTFKLILG